MFAFVKKIVKTIQYDSVTVYAAQASFYIIISGIPFIYLLLIPVTRLISGDYAEIGYFIELLLPQPLWRVVVTVFNEIEGKTDIRLLGFSALTLVWTASRSTGAVERGVMRVYKNEIKRSFLSNVMHSIIYTILFAAIIILTFILLVVGEKAIELLSYYFHSRDGVYNALGIVRIFGAFIALSVIFSFIYRSFSGRRDGVIKHIYGGVVSSAGWMIFSKLFSVYVMYFSNHSYLYGSFAAVVLFMLWVYCCMIIFLIGAEINVYLKGWRLK